jgi:hypothetical protein
MKMPAKRRFFIYLGILCAMATLISLCTRLKGENFCSIDEYAFSGQSQDRLVVDYFGCLCDKG